MQALRRLARIGVWTIAAGVVVGFGAALGTGKALGDPPLWKAERLADLPDREGFAGLFAGWSDGALLAAGGANFPGKKPWEGGVKHWSDAIFAIERSSLKKDAAAGWRRVGRLPRPLGYGVSATHGGDLLCVGGADGDRHYAEAFRLRWERGTVRVLPMPALPKPCANACGGIVGRTFYVVGGTESPNSTTALRTAWALDLSDEPSKQRWREIEPLPGPGRILAVAGALGDSFYAISGASLAPDAQGKPARTYLKDVWRYSPSAGWARRADAPTPMVAAPSPALALGSRLGVLGGDDGSLVDFEPKSAHPGFSRRIWAYDPAADAWSAIGEIPKAAARVTTPLIRDGEDWIMPSGEIRPGTRSPEVWSFRRVPNSN